jgi:5-methylthioadenosine/S-adenosylhomocysteine deaminase
MPDAHNSYALRGRIVTMAAKNPDQQDTIFNDGVIYIKNGLIDTIAPPNAAAPAGFENAPLVNTRGTIYPGLIEMHNHLAYNILPLWTVTRIYTNNGQWRSAEDKRKFISGPMTLLRNAGGYLGAIARYVEAKCLVAGVTTSQGLTLINAGGIEKKFRGIVRNPEAPDHLDLPVAGHRIDDIDSNKPIKPEDFLIRLNNQNGCFLLHLSEGIDDVARTHFAALEFPDHSNWAITDTLVGIHSAGLCPEDFPIFKQFDGSMVWSPLSNLMLYGETARIQAAKDNEVLIALGSDWSPSGSKNLLAELKIARTYSNQHGNIFTDVELVRMVTSNPARMLKWDALLGSIEENKLADLLVIGGKQGDPYAKLIAADEMDVRLVTIGGVPRYGSTTLMGRLGQNGEKHKLTKHGHSQEWVLNFVGAPDSGITTLTLKQAHDRLEAGLAALPNPPQLEEPVGAAFGDGTPIERFTLVLDNDDLEADASRALGPLTTTEVIGELLAAATDLHDLVKPLVIDELTVAENPEKYVAMLAAEPRLPDSIKSKLKALYGAN